VLADLCCGFVWFGGEVLVQRMPCMFVERCFLISFEDLDFLEEKIARMACVEWRFRNYGNPCGINGKDRVPFCPVVFVFWAFRSDEY